MGVEIAIGVAIGAVVGGTAAAVQSGGDFDAIWKGALVGAAGGAVGGWAAPALTGTLGAVGGGMAAGGLGGVTSGLLGAAINGGTGDDYWKGALFGGLGGAAVGGVTAGLGEAFGSSAAPVDASGNMVTGTPYTSDVTGATTPLTDGSTVASTLTPTAAAGGVGGTNIDASSAINASVSGATAPPTGGLESLGSTGALQAQQGLQSLGLSSLGEGTSTPFTPNMSTPSNVGIGGGDYGVTTASGNVFDSSGNQLGVAPGFETQGVPTVRGTADVVGDSGWSMDKLFNWNTGKDMMGKVLMGNMMGNALKGVGSVAGMNEARQNQNQLMDLYNMQKNQYQTQANAANAYQTQLGETYSDPDAYLNSPEAVASRQLAMQKLLAQNAMAGRRTAGLPMQNQLMMNQLSNLANYRAGLRGAASGAYPSAAGLGTTLSAAQAQSPTGNLMAGLGSIFAPAATYYMM